MESMKTKGENAGKLPKPSQRTSVWNQSAVWSVAHNNPSQTGRKDEMGASSSHLKCILQLQREFFIRFTERK